MALACPQCKQVFEKNGVCPLCNVILLYHADNLKTDSPSASDAVEPVSPWQQTPWGRIVIGLILAQGLSFGLEQLLTAGFLATSDAANPWATVWGLVIRHTIAAVALIVGGVLAGAGQTRGIVYGAIVGLANGLISLILHSKDAESEWLAYGEPVLHLAVGAIGGGLGMLIWRPAPTLADLGGDTPAPEVASSIASFFSNLFTGQIHIARVCAGAFIIVIGVVWAKAIMNMILRYSQGTLSITSHVQAELVSLEIAALFALLGSAIAGATTANGFKQGVCVGLGASAIVLGIQISSPRFTIDSALLTVVGIIIIALVGGWFGGQLFPPLVARRKRGLAAYE
jgi:hypothetical protein